MVLSKSRLAAGDTVRDGIFDLDVPDVSIFLQNQEVARTYGIRRTLVPDLAS